MNRSAIINVVPQPESLGVKEMPERLEDTLAAIAAHAIDLRALIALVTAGSTEQEKLERVDELIDLLTNCHRVPMVIGAATILGNSGIYSFQFVYEYPAYAMSIMGALLNNTMLSESYAVRRACSSALRDVYDMSCPLFGDAAQIIPLIEEAFSTVDPSADREIYEDLEYICEDYRIWSMTPA